MHLSGTFFKCLLCARHCLSRFLLPSRGLLWGGVGSTTLRCVGGGVSGRAAALRVVSVMQGHKSVLDALLIGGPVYICRLRDHRQEQHPGCPESFRVLGLVQHPSISPEYSPHGHQQHRAGTGEAGGA